jgi:hypothetical protein
MTNSCHYVFALPTPLISFPSPLLFALPFLQFFLIAIRVPLSLPRIILSSHLIISSLTLAYKESFKYLMLLILHFLSIKELHFLPLKAFTPFKGQSFKVLINQ